MAIMGAAREHASQKELDACKLEASQISECSQTANSRKSSDPDILDIEKCMKAKGYMRVEDIAGVCNLLAIVQCFERQ
jgi:hypothetical protein